MISARRSAQFSVLLNRFFPRLSGYFAMRTFLTPEQRTTKRPPEPLLQSAQIRNCKSGRKIYIIGKGPLVGCLHGWSGSFRDFDFFISPLYNAGFSIALWDAPGHGANPSELVSMPMMTKCYLQDLADQNLQPRFLIGHSLGGAMAIFATKLGLPIEKIITIGSPASMPRIFQKFCERLKLSEKSKRAFYFSTIAKAGHSPEEISPANLVKSILAKGLIIHDENDEDVSILSAQELLADWKDAQALITKDLGHRKILRNNEAVNRSVEFLKS